MVKRPGAIEVSNIYVPCVIKRCIGYMFLLLICLKILDNAESCFTVQDKICQKIFMMIIRNVFALVNL